MYPDQTNGHLADQLSELENAELVRHLPNDDDAAYFFKHALTQESAYESLLLKKRRDIHRLVADAYAELYPTQLDENAALLAQHYEKAGDDANTVVFATRAGDAAARVFAYAEAGSHYTRALDALARLPDTNERQQQRVDTTVKQVSVSLRTVGPVESLRRLAEVESVANKFAARDRATRQDRLRLARVHYWQGHALIHQNDTHAAIQRMRQVLQVAQAENDPQLLAIPASIIGRSLLAQGQFAKANTVLSAAVAALEQFRNEHERIMAMGFRAVAITISGDYAGGVAQAQRTLTSATESNTLTGIAFAHGMLGLVQLFGNAGDLGIAQAHASIDVAAESGDRLYEYIAHGFIAWARVRAGDCRAAEQEFAQTRAISQEIGGRLLFADWFETARAEHALRCGQVEQALALATELVSHAQEDNSLFVEGVGERIWAQALSRIQTARPDEAEKHFASSLAALEQGGARLEAARTRIAWGQTMAQRKNTAAAREQFQRAAEQFQASGLVTELEETKRLMNSLPKEAA